METVAESGDSPAPHALGQQLTHAGPELSEAAATEVDLHRWRATGLETPVFADPSGRRARAMGGIGLAVLATTLAALVIVATAAIGFSSLPAPTQGTRGTRGRVAASTVKRHTGREFAIVADGPADRRDRHRYVATRLVQPTRQAAVDRTRN